MTTNSRKEQLLAMLESEPNDSFLLFALAKELEKELQFLEAKSIYEKLYANDKAYLALYYHYGKLLEKLNQKEEAYNIYEEGVIKSLEANDLHTKSELQTALMNLQIELLG
jgi:tetratricopeptide (TPR) repeat protein